MFVFVVAAVLLAGVSASVRDYVGEQVVKCTIDTKEKADFISMMEHEEELDVFMKHQSQLVHDIRVNAKQYQMIQAEGILCEVMIDDLASMIAAAAERRQRYTGQRSEWFEEYHTYAEQTAYYRDMCTEYGSICRTASIGFSTLGNEQFEYTIAVNRSKPVFYLDTLIHAREWIAGAGIVILFSFFSFLFWLISLCV